MRGKPVLEAPARELIQQNPLVLRYTRPDLPRPFRMWFYPLPALIASIGFGYILFVRVNALKEIRYAIVVLILGIAIYLTRAWRHREWPFNPGTPALEGHV